MTPLRCFFVLLFLTIATIASAEIFQGVEYSAPSGWKIEPSQGALGFVPSDVTPETGIVMVLGEASDLGSQSFQQWFDQQLQEELSGGAKVIQESESKKSAQGNVQTFTLVRVIEDTEMGTTIRFYHAVTDGRKAAMAMSIAVSENAINKYSDAVRTFFGGLRISGSVSRGSSTRSKGERVPEAGVMNGRPQGLFVGRSLLSGKAVCLLFLDGGRITRSIPESGLENFHWMEHAVNHSGDCGTWQLTGNLLRIVWGDGGVHEGPLKVNPNGIEFYGKTYARIGTVSIASISGEWESARGTAAWGGEGITMTHSLSITADGKFHWVAGGGGVVSGHAVQDRSKDTRGKLQIVGATAIFTSDDGTVETYTFTAVPGNPTVAFGLDQNMFTRKDQ